MFYITFKIREYIYNHAVSDLDQARVGFLRTFFYSDLVFFLLSFGGLVPDPV